jgi:hypothetical protein
MPGISNTIVVKLGGSNNDNANKEDDGDNKYTNDIHYEYDTMANKPMSFVFVMNREAALRQEAIEKRIRSSKHLPLRL